MKLPSIFQPNRQAPIENVDPREESPRNVLSFLITSGVSTYTDYFVGEIFAGFIQAPQPFECVEKHVRVPEYLGQPDAPVHVRLKFISNERRIFNMVNLSIQNLQLDYRVDIQLINLEGDHTRNGDLYNLISKSRILGFYKGRLSFTISSDEDDKVMIFTLL